MEFHRLLVLLECFCVHLDGEDEIEAHDLRSSIEVRGVVAVDADMAGKCEVVLDEVSIEFGYVELLGSEFVHR